MTLFQSIVQVVLAAFAEFLPIAEGAHRRALGLWLDWPSIGPALSTAIALGACGAAFLYYWADWASMLSATFQLLLYRRKPRTLDEKLPWSILLAALPPIFFWIYVTPFIPDAFLTPEATGIGLILGAYLYSVTERFSRKTRQLHDWTPIDALFLGVSQICWLLPGAGRIWGSLIAAFLRNHGRESAAKFSIYVSFPVLAFLSLNQSRGVNWSAAQADSQGTSWLVFGLLVVLSLLTSLLAINTFINLSRKEGLTAWIRYRAVLGIAILAHSLWQFVR